MYHITATTLPIIYSRHAEKSVSDVVVVVVVVVKCCARVPTPRISLAPTQNPHTHTHTQRPHSRDLENDHNLFAAEPRAMRVCFLRELFAQTSWIGALASLRKPRRIRDVVASNIRQRRTRARSHTHARTAHSLAPVQKTKWTATMPERPAGAELAVAKLIRSGG